MGYFREKGWFTIFTEQTPAKNNLKQQCPPHKQESTCYVLRAATQSLVKSLNLSFANPSTLLECTFVITASLIGVIYGKSHHGWDGVAVVTTIASQQRKTQTKNKKQPMRFRLNCDSKSSIEERQIMCLKAQNKALYECMVTCG